MKKAVAMFFVSFVFHKWPFNSVDMNVYTVNTHTRTLTIEQYAETVAASLNDYIARETNKMALISSFS